MDGLMAVSSADKVLGYIDETVENIYRELHTQPGGVPSITLKRISQLKPYQQPDGQTRWEIESRDTRYSFPGKTKDEARRFACVLSILTEIQRAIHQGIIVTKRDIFYRDPKLFIKQETVDRLIEDIAHTCNVQRIDLHIVASPRGLVVGISQSNEPETTPVSLGDRSIGHLKWILVVEKEASRHNICMHLKLTASRQLFNRCQIRHGIEMTAKGFPDLATLRFLRMVLDHPVFSGPIFGLLDMDPYGIEILRCYRTGSKISLGDTQSRVPEMQWLGLRLEHLAEKDAAVLELTMRDRSRARKMLESMTLMNGEVVPGTADCRAEAQRMLMAGKKAEIQTAESVMGIARWLEERMATAVSEAR
ncbi:hypothetical protein DV736_g4730, partial [Chaetothyriales sp. CBS 134916]